MLRELVLIDDEPGFHRLLQEALLALVRPEHWRLTYFSDSVSALAHMRLPGPVPALTLLDIDLPNGDGPRVLEQIRADERLYLARVVLLSGGEENSDRERVFRKLANGVVIKPFSFEELIRILTSLLSS